MKIKPSAITRPYPAPVLKARRKRWWQRQDADSRALAERLARAVESETRDREGRPADPGTA